MGAFPGAAWRSRGYTCPSYRLLRLFRGHFWDFLGPFGRQFSCLGITFRVDFTSKLLRFPDIFIRVLFHDYRCFELYSARNRLRADRKREGGGRGDTDIWKHGETEPPPFPFPCGAARVHRSSWAKGPCVFGCEDPLTVATLLYYSKSTTKGLRVCGKRNNVSGVVLSRFFCLAPFARFIRTILLDNFPETSRRTRWASPRVRLFLQKPKF